MYANVEPVSRSNLPRFTKSGRGSRSPVTRPPVVVIVGISKPLHSGRFYLASRTPDRRGSHLA